MNEYSQGICQDGAAILKDGVPMTVEEILDALRKLAAAERQIDGLQNHARKVQDKLAAAEADAGRYRFIRDREARMIYRKDEHRTLDESIDAAIDAARGASHE